MTMDWLEERNGDIAPSRGERSQTSDTSSQELAACRESLRLLALELSRVEDLERQRIARDLHDDLGQALVSAQLRLSDLEERDGDEDKAQALSEVRLLISEAIKSSRTVTFELMAPVMPELGIEAELQHLASRLNEMHGVPCRLDIDAEPKPLSTEVAVTVLRVVREILLNITKHSRAGKASLSVVRVGDEIRVTVSDDGIGFLPSPRSEPERVGFGLLIIGERLAEIGGTLQIDSEPGSGTRVIVTAPLLVRP